MGKSIEVMVEELKGGKKLCDIAMDDPGSYRTHGKILALIENDIAPKRNTMTHCVWFCGSSNCDKMNIVNQYIKDNNKDVYWKTEGGRMWDGYYGQDVVVIEELNRNKITHRDMCLLVDCHRHSVLRTRTTRREFNSKVIFVVTSNGPEHYFEEMKDPNYAAQINRRIKVVRLGVGDKFDIDKYLLERDAIEKAYRDNA